MDISMVRLAVTGIGFVSPLGKSPRSFTARLLGGKSGIAERRFRGRHSPTLVGNIQSPLRATGPKQWPVSRSTAMSLEAAALALAQANIPDDADVARIGIIHCTTRGNLKALCHFRREIQDYGLGKTSPMQFPSTIMHCSAGFLSIAMRTRAFNLTISAGVSSAIDAIVRAEQMLNNGLCDYCVCIAAEEVSLELLTFIEGENELDSDYPDPFGAKRAGYVLGEGGVAIVCEHPSSAIRRQARIIAAILGYQLTRHAGLTLSYEELFLEAIASSHLRAKDIKAIIASASGSSSDRFEAEAISHVFGPNLQVTAPKGTFGDCGSVAPLLGLVSMIQSIGSGVCPPTLGRSQYDTKLPAINLVRSTQMCNGGPMIFNALEYGRNSGALIASVGEIGYT